jgi:dipeptidyl aminopeptidase/acylaminoacyl peptidase
MAARALAGAGILVLQVGEDACQLANTEEASCSADGYESAVKQLQADRLVDRDRIGIIGFSRTCYAVMHLLTTSSLKMSAASITDGVMDDYLQYMHAVDFESDGMIHDFDATIGAPPFGAGLQIWRERSPLFNIQRVNAALLVVGEGEPSLLGMWGPYAALRLLKKPTELVLLNTDEHVLTTPAVRLASQGGTVDWFRFWLQGYEDLDPKKTEQYTRWENLCDAQRPANPGQPAFCVATRAH